MLATRKAHEGAGLAAPQVGKAVQLVVIGEIVMINPMILWTKGSVENEEGCLSFPGQTFTVSRASQVGVGCQDLDGVFWRSLFEGFWAACFQHELDHLDGITVEDRVKIRRASTAPGAQP